MNKKLQRLMHLQDALHEHESYEYPETDYTSKGEPVLFTRYEHSHGTALFVFTANKEFTFQKHQIDLSFVNGAIRIMAMKMPGKGHHDFGYESYLLRKAEEIARESGAEKIEYAIESDHTPSFNRLVALFKKNQFKVYGGSAEKRILPLAPVTVPHEPKEAVGD
ncbi:hypothetical protein CR205_11905 [Alteribacter lacisalsi]|uniref:GNAT family N-acetyltransferase n=1 Tax=Alteribacter lacisalsi TaxID=2045244 RepID=A0A2W0H8L6_9BACI|nr:hypothetical protein [Alteribacter lacisalsi]PYZ96420.1 hypothetical protein CR205_11905 [Alteribacter lacisalsi]